MKIMTCSLLAALALSGCATMGLAREYKAEGPLAGSLINGPVSFDFVNPKAASKTLSRGKKMHMAGATVEARLSTIPGAKLNYLVDAQRTRETRETIEAEFAKMDKDADTKNLCVIATLTHRTIDLAKASRWTLKASIDDGAWLPLKAIGRDSVPNFSTVGGVTDWWSVGLFCGKADGWTAAKSSVRVQVFPPVFVNPGETVLTWSLAANAPKP